MNILKRSRKILAPLSILVEKHINVPGLFALRIESLSNRITKFIFRIKELNNVWILEQGCGFIRTSLVVSLHHVCPDDNYTNVLIPYFFQNRFLNGFSSLQTPTAGRG